MKALGRYTIVALVIVAAVLAICWPLLDAAGRAGLGVAVAVTLPAQVGLFALLVGARRDPTRFMVWWGLGVLARMGLVAAVGLTVRSLATLDATVALMSTVGLFFIFLLLEPVFLLRDEQVSQYAR